MRAQVTLKIAEQPLTLATDVTLVPDVIPLAVADWNEDCGVVFRQVIGRLKLAFDIVNLPRILAFVGLFAYWLVQGSDFGGEDLLLFVDPFLIEICEVIENLDGIDISHSLIKSRLLNPTGALLDPVACKIELEEVQDHAIGPALVYVRSNGTLLRFHV